MDDHMEKNLSFEPLVNDLKNGNMEARQAAARSLGELNDNRAVEPLIAALEKVIGDGGVGREGALREKIIIALGQLHDARAVEILVKALHIEFEKYTRAYLDSDIPEAIEDPETEPEKALVKIGEPSVKPLLGLMSSTASLTHGEQLVVERILSKIGLAAVEPLIVALIDGNENVRAMAAKLLYWLKDKRTIEPFISALSDENMWVRHYAADALGDLGDTRAIEPLKAAQQDKEYYVREPVERALKKLQPNRKPTYWVNKRES